MRLDDEGVARFGGLQVCASVWICPVCSAAIREQRAKEIEAAGRLHLAAGGGLEFLTLTIPHDYGDSLGPLLTVLSKSWTRVLHSRGVRSWAESFGKLEYVRAIEVTDGRHGWHPHLHVLLFTRAPLSEDERAALGAVVASAWGAAIERGGLRRPSAEHGVRLDPVRGQGAGAGALAAYLTKIQDDEGQAHDVAREVTRGDLKRGRRRASLTPFEILERAIAGDARSIARWQEYEQGTRGKKCLTWSQGLRQRLGVAELVDEEAAAAAPGVEILRISDRDWRLIERYNWQCRVLDHVEDFGLDGLVDYLRPLYRRADFDARRERAG